MKKTILFCPVREAPEIFATTLHSHQQLEDVAERWYVDDNDATPAGFETSHMLDNQIRIGPGAGSSLLLPGPAENAAGRPHYHKDGETHHWTGDLTVRMSEIRDAGVTHFRESDADYLFILDSDLIPHPDTVRHLVSLNREIVSEVFWSKWTPAGPWLPNVWDAHNYAFAGSEHITRLRHSGTYRVGGLGAMTLISRAAVKAGARYESVPGVNQWGEDRHFCIRAVVLGIPLWADTFYPPFHVYRADQLHEAIQWKHLHRCDPSYFRERWLTEEWAAQIYRMGANQ